jgi:hypothetical protein
LGPQKGMFQMSAVPSFEWEVRKGVAGRELM